MSLEQQIKDVIEAAARQLSGQIAERLQGLAGEVSQAASAERVSVVRELRMASEAEIARRSQEAVAASQAEHARRLEEAVAAARQEGSRRIDEAVAFARGEQSRKTEDAVAAVRAELTRERETALMSARSEIARKVEEAVAAARSEAARALAEAVARARADADDRLAQRVELARHEALQAADRALVDGRALERQAELARVERLADGVRRLDDARSLTDVLDVLVETAARDAPRVAVFLVRGTRLFGWRAVGLPAEIDPRRVEIPLAEPGLVTRAVRASAAVATSDAAGGESVATPFGDLPSDAAGVAVPVRVGGEAVAVLYADDAVTGGREVPSAWPEVVELLARHAARCLEVLTVSRVAQPATVAPPSVQAAPPRYAPGARAHASTSDDDDDSARRYAKLLVSEIKLYHEGAVTQGRLDRNLLNRLSQEIERARRLYDDRVPAAVRSKTDHFGQELVRTLANGDSALLGSV